MVLGRLAVTLALSISIITACEGAQLNPGGKGSNQSRDLNSSSENYGGSGTPLPTPPSSQAPVPLPAGGATVPGGEDGLEELPSPVPDRAAIPVAVGGASLTCSVPDPAKFEAECLVTSSQGVAIDALPSLVYFIEAKTRKWNEAPFRKIEKLGAFIVTLPYSVAQKSFAIAFSFGESHPVPLLDWVINPLDPVASAVLNGGFEAVRVPDTTDITNQFMDASNSTLAIWRVKSRTEPCANILELSNQAKDPSTVAVEGTQWTELDSSCAFDRLGGERQGNNIALYQDTILIPGDYYELTFQYRKRGTRPNLQKMQVTLDTEVVLNKDVTEAAWTSYKFVFKASKALSRLQFEEMGFSDDGEGTLLDDVRLHSFGNNGKPFGL